MMQQTDIDEVFCIERSETRENWNSKYFSKDMIRIFRAESFPIFLFLGVQSEKSLLKRQEN